MLPIVFQDEDLIAVHKPAGVLVHRTRLAARDSHFVLQELRQQLGQKVYPAHRLDRATSGVLLFGLTPEVGAALSRMFAKREIDKTYVAVVRGHPAAAGIIDHPLTPNRDELGVDCAAKPAQTRYRRLATVELEIPVAGYPRSRYALLELHPITGRRHQLRRHMKHISHPIIGDTRYGKGNHNRLFREHFGCTRLLLAGVELRFDHPIRNEPVICTAPLAPDYSGLIERFAWQATLPRRWLQ